MLVSTNDKMDSGFEGEQMFIFILTHASFSVHPKRLKHQPSAHHTLLRHTPARPHTLYHAAQRGPPLTNWELREVVVGRGRKASCWDGRPLSVPMYRDVKV